MKLILPKNYVDIGNDPVIFLAGPIKGAPTWQDRAIEIIHSIEPDIWIASPSIHLRNSYIINAKKGDLNKFSRQLDWERYYLKCAGNYFSNRKGAVLFWLPTQIEAMPNNPKTGFPQPYARDTRGELGRFGYGPLEKDKDYPIAVGYEDNFDGIDIILRNFLAEKEDMTFFKSLEDTCREALRLANL